MTGSSDFSRAAWVRLRAELVEHERAGLAVATRTTRGRAGLLAGAAGGTAAAGVGGGAGTGVAREQLDDLLTDPAEVGAELDEDLGGDALTLADQTEQDVLGADVVVTELQRLAEAELEDLLGTRREGDVAAGRRAALTDDLLDLVADRFEADAERFQGLGRDTLAFVNQPEQDVLGADVVVVEQTRFFLRQHHHSSSPVGEPLEHRDIPPRGWGLRGKRAGARSSSVPGAFRLSPSFPERDTRVRESSLPSAGATFNVGKFFPL